MGMHKLQVEEWLVSAVMSMYIGAKTVVGTVYSNNRPNCFAVKVGMHQLLLPTLFYSSLDFVRNNRTKDETFTHSHLSWSTIEFELDGINSGSWNHSYQ